MIFLKRINLTKKLDAAQTIHRYVQDRYALKALKIIEPEVIEEIKDELKVLDLWSIAKMYRILGLINKARKIIDYAIQKFQDDDMVKIEYANILYLTENHNDQEKAHQIINEIIEKKDRSNRGKRDSCF